MTVVHDLRHLEPGDAYDQTQTDDSIKHGDVLLTAEGVGVMYVAWPTVLIADADATDERVFHRLKEDATWPELLADSTQLRGPAHVQAMQDALLVAWALACG